MSWCLTPGILGPSQGHTLGDFMFHALAQEAMNATPVCPLRMPSSRGAPPAGEPAEIVLQDAGLGGRMPRGRDAQTRSSGEAKILDRIFKMEASGT